jgi:2-keto-4-pentenoate hydratase/2-oxohepta-3-ene-1,7-dioic acid hydratase in catechol pathway
MRWATYQHAGQPDERVGLLVDGRLHGLPPGVALLDLLGDDGERLAQAGDRARREPAEVVALADVRLRAPIPRPPTVRDFYAFEQHVRAGRQRWGYDIDPVWYDIPVFYFSNPYAIVATGDAVAVPPGCAALDFELEVAAIIGRAGADLSPAEAERYIAGYTVMNDWSARDVQRREMRLGLGPAKGKDFATTLGPYLVTPDELAPYRAERAYDLAMTAHVNGRECSRASLASIYWSFGEMIAWASQGTRVAPGDIIGSGTCGTGCIAELSLTHGEAAYTWLAPGDQVELTVEHLGGVTNRIIAGGPARPLR